MNAIPSPSTSGSETGDRVRRALALLPLTLLVMSFQVAAQEQTAAVWKVREVDFFYRSSTAIYSCRALQGRVATILRAVGARDDVQVDVNDCDESMVPPNESINPWQNQSTGFLDRRTDRRTTREQLAHVRVRLMIPTEVTPEVLAEMERDKQRRELVSRVTANPAAMFDDPIVFSAQRQPVTLSRQSIGLQPEECELLEQMSTSVFRELDIRVVRRAFHCSRNHVSRIPPQITVEALIGTPLGATGGQETPAEGESDRNPSAPAPIDTEPSEPATATKPE